MILSDIKKCDLCEFVYDVFDVAKNYKNYDSYEGEMVFSKLNSSKTVFRIDVCPNCFEEFYDRIDKVIESMTKGDKS